MRKVALLILLVVALAVMVPMLASAHCDLQGTAEVPSPVHCGGDAASLSGFVAVEDAPGHCIGVGGDAVAGPVLINGDCPEH